MFNLSKKDEVNLLSILDSISKIEIYTQDISNEDVRCNVLIRSSLSKKIK